MSEHPTFAASIMRQVLASPATLAKLAARGMFASVPLNMPQDIHSANIQILFEGEVTERSVIEVYAPGDETGWAVVYKPSEEGMHTGETELIFGRWELVRGEHEFSRAAAKAKREAGEVQLVDEASKFELTDRELDAEPKELGITLEDEPPLRADEEIEVEEGELEVITAEDIGVLDLEDEDDLPPEPTDAETFGDLPREDFGETELTDDTEIDVVEVTDVGKLSGIPLGERAGRAAMALVDRGKIIRTTEEDMSAHASMDGKG